MKKFLPKPIKRYIFSIISYFILLLPNNCFVLEADNCLHQLSAKDTINFDIITKSTVYPSILLTKNDKISDIQLTEINNNLMFRKIKNF